MKLSNFLPSSLLTIILIQGCAGQKQLVPTGGSRADGTVKLSYEYGLFEAPKLDAQQGMRSAQQRCSSWGYKNAEAFGGSTKSCINISSNGCDRWLVTLEYQCTESTLNAPAQSSNAINTQPTSSSISKHNDRMNYIKELKDKGIITQEEYDAKRKEILKDL